MTCVPTDRVRHVRKPITPKTGSAMANRWRLGGGESAARFGGLHLTRTPRGRYYQYLNLDTKEVPRTVEPHFLTYDEDADADDVFGGENLFLPIVKKARDARCRGAVTDAPTGGLWQVVDAVIVP